MSKLSKFHLFVCWLRSRRRKLHLQPRWRSSHLFRRTLLPSSLSKQLSRSVGWRARRNQRWSWKTRLFCSLTRSLAAVSFSLLTCCFPFPNRWEQSVQWKTTYPRNPLSHKCHWSQMKENQLPSRTTFLLRHNKVSAKHCQMWHQNLVHAGTEAFGAAKYDFPSCLVVNSDLLVLEYQMYISCIFWSIYNFRFWAVWQRAINVKQINIKQTESPSLTNLYPNPDVGLKAFLLYFCLNLFFYVTFYTNKKQVDPLLKLGQLLVSSVSSNYNVEKWVQSHFL